MRLICPSCGAIHSSESWLSDADARQCLRLLPDFPWDVSRRVFNYLALFRPVNGRGLIWSKTLRLLRELQVLVAAPTVKWNHQQARPNSNRAWALAMERMIEAPPHKLPVKTHGYLNAIAYEIANDMDKKTEQKKNAEQRTPGRTNLSENETSERINFKDMQQIRKKNMGTK